MANVDFKSAILATCRAKLDTLRLCGTGPGTEALAEELMSTLEFWIRLGLQADKWETLAMAACGDCSPSAGHDWIDEVLGLLSVARVQRDDANGEVANLRRLLDEQCSQNIELRSKFSLVPRYIEVSNKLLNLGNAHHPSCTIMTGPSCSCGYDQLYDEKIRLQEQLRIATEGVQFVEART